ncbi:hypothetical protein Aperf_G00000015415 [Anoplocephala perfoliata]
MSTIHECLNLMKSTKGSPTDENYSDRDIVNLAIQAVTQDEDTPDDLEVLLAKKKLLKCFHGIIEQGFTQLYGFDLRTIDEFEWVNKKNVKDTPEPQLDGDKLTLMECSQSTTTISRGNGQKILKLIRPPKDNPNENFCYIPATDDESAVPVFTRK